MWYVFNKLLFVSLLIIICSCSNDSNTITPIDFDASLGKGQWRPFNEMAANKSDESRYLLLKEIWKRRGPVVKLTPASTPKIIHQIWLGPNPLPDFFPEYQRKLQALHPKWEYRLWTDKDVEQEAFSLWPQIQECSNYGQKSDLVRLEILSRYGGVYVDVDVLMVKPFDPIVSRYDFFAGVEAPHFIGERSDRYLFVTNAIIGSAPQHPILNLWKKRILQNWSSIQVMDVDMVQKVLLSTFFPFGDAVEEGIEENEHSVIFPPTYFYPIKPPNKSEQKKRQPSIVKRVLQFLHLKRAPAFSTIQRETIAIHDFASTWQGESGT